MNTGSFLISIVCQNITGVMSDLWSQLYLDGSTCSRSSKYDSRYVACLMCVGHRPNSEGGSPALVSAQDAALQERQRAKLPQ